MDCDRLPKRMTLMKAYKAIYRWYRSNRDFFERFVYFKSLKSDRIQALIALSNALPKPNNISEIEIRAVLIEVIKGNLEDCYSASDGSYKMCAYSRAGLDSIGKGESEFTPEEMSLLAVSPLWPYLYASKYKYYESEQNEIV